MYGNSSCVEVGSYFFNPRTQTRPSTSITMMPMVLNPRTQTTPRPPPHQHKSHNGDDNDPMHATPMIGASYSAHTMRKPVSS